MSCSSSPSREYIYSGGALIAKIDSSGTKYYHQDHLSNRYVTDASGNKVAEMGTFPYGEKWYNASNDKLVFTTYERDAESGNDYAQARYNVSGLARFSSPDPIAGSTSDPQSLNRYSCVRNMPVMLIDPTGMMTTCNTVENRDSNQSQDSKTGGPSASDLSADPDPPVVCGGGGGGGGAPCEYTLSGCGDPFAPGFDGGFSGDDSGLAPTFGVGSSPGVSGQVFVPYSIFVPVWDDPERGGVWGYMLQGLDIYDYSTTTTGGDPGGGGDDVGQLRLVVKQDCLDLNGRFINYALVNISTGKPPNGSYTVTEHVSDGVSSSDGPNLFNDTQGAPIMAGLVWNAKQSFTISGPGVADNPLVPVRMNGQDYGTLGIFRKGNGNLQNATILINGQPAPVSMPLGKYCPNDRMREGH